MLESLGEILIQDIMHVDSIPLRVRILIFILMPLQSNIHIHIHTHSSQYMPNRVANHLDSLCQHSHHTSLSHVRYLDFPFTSPSRDSGFTLLSSSTHTRTTDWFCRIRRKEIRNVSIPRCFSDSDDMYRCLRHSLKTRMDIHCINLSHSHTW
jgi:hypothetical protein